MSAMAIGRPQASEHIPYYRKYIDLVPGDDLLAALSGQIADSLATLRGVTPAESLYRYAPGKWSMRQVIGHLIDVERILAYRALRFARGDERQLIGFEPDEHVAGADFDARDWPDLLAELELLRRADVLMFRAFRPEDWRRVGVADGNRVSVRALGYGIAGHEMHHLRMIRGTYLAGVRDQR